MRKLALLLAAALCAAPALAEQPPDVRQIPTVLPAETGDHLDPVQPIPDDRLLLAYDARLRESFKEMYGNGVRIRMIAKPSFSAEYAVGIVQSGDAYRVLYLQEPTNLWYHGSGKSPLAPSRCNVGIDASLAKRLVDVWKLMLGRVPSDAPGRGGLDGTGYDFYMRQEERGAAAQTWSPAEGTAPARLVDIAVTMTRYCRAKEFWLIRPASWYFAVSLNRQIDGVLARLRSGGSKK